MWSSYISSLMPMFRSGNGVLEWDNHFTMQNSQGRRIRLSFIPSPSTQLSSLAVRTMRYSDDSCVEGLGIRLSHIYPGQSVNKGNRHNTCPEDREESIIHRYKNR